MITLGSGLQLFDEVSYSSVNIDGTPSGSSVHACGQQLTASATSAPAPRGKFGATTKFVFATQLLIGLAEAFVQTRARSRSTEGDPVDAILLGIDGTGPLGDRAYHGAMHNSFVRYIIRNSPAKAKQYQRGPAMDGFDMAVIAANGYEFVHLSLVTNPQAKVYLTGYSRGGAGVIAIAQRLAKDDVKVSAMMLFDAVDRAFGIDSTDIPNNVEHVVHARRDPYAFTRNSFGNCGTKWHSPTKCDVKYFRGTHGAIGGCPWPIPLSGKPSDFISENGEATPTLITYAQDAYAARAVWGWVKPRLDTHGFFGASATPKAVVS